MANLASAILDPLLRSDPTTPRITYYDDARPLGEERIELSTVTLANWAAKTGNLLRDELGAGPGSRVAVLLPAHWQTAGVLLGVWWIGAEVVLGTGGGEGDVVMCTAERIPDADALARPAGEVVALSLDPLGRPVADLPVGVTDYATSVRVHGDQITAEGRPGAALGGKSPDDVLAAAREHAAAQGISSSERVMSCTEWDTDEALTATMLAVFAVGASLVQVAHADPSALERRRSIEKVTKSLC